MDSEINKHFLEKYKSTLKLYKVDIPLFSDFLTQFAKQDKDNSVYKEIIKIMLDLPYTEDDGKTLVPMLRKFRILKEKLESVNGDIENELILERLANINVPKTLPKKKETFLIDLPI